MNLRSLSLGTLICTLFLFGCSPAQRAVNCGDEASLCVNLSYKNSEMSEDSNSTQETLNIVDQDVLYTWEYDGYHPDEDFDRTKEVSFSLTDEDYKALKDLIEDTTLLTSVEENQSLSIDGAMSLGSVDMTLDITLDDQSAHSTIFGLEDAYMGNGERISNIENEITISDVKKIISFIKNVEEFPKE